ncbi:hypothetical protein F5Y17DRAFT_459783 [Xylariaceae sp. FL0594]|nr:hypothetical protein F5Y17DRAFT_459783 [Xylariaceae sp. FL0594]
MLPEGPVHVGHLILNDDSGEWDHFKELIDDHIVQLRKQLNRCTSILDWVKTWNSCIGRFFSHTLGEPAFCFGRKHVDSVLEVYQKIQKTLFQEQSRQGTGEGNVVGYLKSKIEERFGVTGIPDAFIFLPESLGGLGVKNPFIPYLAHRQNFNSTVVSPEKIMARFFVDERSAYSQARQEYLRLSTPEERLSRLRSLYPDDIQFEYARLMLGPVLTPGRDEEFMSFEEYTEYRESDSRALRHTYCELLTVPARGGLEADTPFIQELWTAGYHTADDSQRLQVLWVLKMYEEELKDLYGGFKLIDAQYLPLGVLDMLRRKGVQWTMVL